MLEDGRRRSLDLATTAEWSDVNVTSKDSVPMTSTEVTVGSRPGRQRPEQHVIDAEVRFASDGHVGRQ